MLDVSPGSVVQNDKVCWEDALAANVSGQDAGPPIISRLSPLGHIDYVAFPERQIARLQR